jgi:hypothetical protein
MRLPIGSLTTSLTVMFTICFDTGPAGSGRDWLDCPTPLPPLQGGKVRVELVYLSSHRRLPGSIEYAQQELRASAITKATSQFQRAEYSSYQAELAKAD